MDGANMNAQVGLAAPGRDRRRCLPPQPAQDLLHPARRRRPGRGADRRRARTWRRSCPATPSSRRRPGRRRRRSAPVSAAPWGSASILPISWVYIAMMGGDGLTPGDRRSRSSTPTTSPRGSPTTTRCSTRGQHGLRRPRVHPRLPRRSRTRPASTAEDIAKRLMDYGFHAPTMSFPVAGTLMIEPTESERKAELDRFCDAMIAIRDEIARDRAPALADRDDNPLKNAPHTADRAAAATGPHAYSRETGRLPAAPGCARPSTGRRSAGSTTSTATATWSAPARRSRATRRRRLGFVAEEAVQLCRQGWPARRPAQLRFEAQASGSAPHSATSVQGGRPAVAGRRRARRAGGRGASPAIAAGRRGAALDSVQRGMRQIGAGGARGPGKGADLRGDLDEPALAGDDAEAVFAPVDHQAVIERDDALEARDRAVQGSELEANRQGRIVPVLRTTRPGCASADRSRSR